MGMLWVVLLVASTGLHSIEGLPLRPTPQIYPHDQSGSSTFEVWGSGKLFAALPALALVVAAVGLVFGCTWCYRHKDCKPNEGTDNQLFTASASHLHDARRTQPPDSGFSEPANNNVAEDNNNGPISLREMQNIANNNATAYIAAENEERNRLSRESVVEFEPLPDIRAADPLERCADWFAGEDLSRNRLQYLREIGRGWFGRVVEGELEEEGGAARPVAVRILSPGARPDERARFLHEARAYRDARHDRLLRLLHRCLREDPWILVFELCTADLQQYLIVNRPKMAILNESGVPLQLMCDVTSALAYLHSRGHIYGDLWSGTVLVRGEAEGARALLGRHGAAVQPPPHDCAAPETRREPHRATTSSEVWSVGYLVWEVCAWGATPPQAPPPPPELPCPYRNHLYQVMQLCWNLNPEARPTAAQVHALINHLHSTHSRTSEAAQDDGYGSSDFEERWQRLKPNTIPKVDEHVAIVHAPSASSHFTASDRDSDRAPASRDTLSVDMDTAVSRSSSIMSDGDPLSVQVKSESLTNLHGSLEDVRNIYLTHNETAALECHQGNMSLDDAREKEHDRSDSSVDPWLKDIITGSQDDVSYYKDVSDVIKNLDNILNSEKTSSSESSHQASPSRDNLSLECKKDYPMQTSMVKSPGISNFQNIVDMGFSSKPEQNGPSEDEEVDRDTIGTLSHSFERYSDTTSQHTLENLTPDTPMKDIDITTTVSQAVSKNREEECSISNNEELQVKQQHSELPNDNKLDNSDSEIPKSMELSVIPSVSEPIIHQVDVKEDCEQPCDNIITEIRTEVKEFEAKSIDGNVTNLQTDQISHIVPADLVTSPVDNIIKSLRNFRSIEKQGNFDTVESQENFSSINSESIEFPDVKQTKSEIESLVNRVMADALQSEPFSPESKDVEAEGIPLKDSDQSKVEIVDACVESNEKIVNEESLSPSGVVLSDDTFPVERWHSIDKTLLISSNITSVGNNITTKLTNSEIGEPHLGETIIISSQSPKDSLTEIKEKFVHDPSLPKSGIVSPSEVLLIESCHSNDKIMLPSTIPGIGDKHIDSEKNPNSVFDDTLYGKTFVIPDESQNSHLELLGSDGAEFSQDMDFEDYASGISNSKLDKELIKNVNFSDDSSQLQKETSGSNKSSSEGSLSVLECTELSNIEKIDFHSKIPQELNQITSIKGEIGFPQLLCVGASILNERLPETSLEIDKISITKETDIHTNAPEVVQSQEKYSPVIETPYNYTKIDECQNISHCENSKSLLVQTPEIVQNIVNNEVTCILPSEKASTKDVTLKDNEFSTNRSDIDSKDNLEVESKEQSSDATAYMDLIYINDCLKDNSIDTNIKDVLQTGLESSSTEEACTLMKNDSTVYLDLPSIIEQTNTFLNSEKRISCQFVETKDAIYASTPKGSANSAETTLEDSGVEQITEILSETRAPDYGPGVSVTKLDQRSVPDSLSPFESPTKSHHTDTYDENSSVVLGPFENCTLEFFKGMKSGCDIVDIPKEELLAFSSNFSEMNLETPSPLRDGNFLNEVPDLQYDDANTLSEAKPLVDEPLTDNVTDETEEQSTTEKRVSPSTPPNSPGNFLATVSQQKFLVDIDVSSPNEAPLVLDPVPSTSPNEVDLDLQITTKMAMAENENNMNIEYSGPLTEEGLITDDSDVMRASDAVPESYLAGNGGAVADLREGLMIDEERMKELRNELELKLPLAQVASIEPSCSAWCEPPPAAALGCGALSPIAEETGQQLSAYENDDHWNTSTRTDSSESYPEPCDNSSDEATEPAAGPRDHSTYTIHSKLEPSLNHTYTVQKDVPSSKELTMSADSLNASPYKRQAIEARKEEPKSIDDRTFNKSDEPEERDSNCERLSQVSPPALLSPTTETSAAGTPTLSKTTVPTDAKSSRPSETQCPSKATSIDSWCSNDTLYNVEENFDDLAMDPEVHADPQREDRGSESEDTLTHDDEDKEPSRCSTYIVHDGESEVDDTFSPDSITANANNTYTKARTDAAPAADRADRSDRDSTKNTQTKDLAYGTLMSGMPSYSNCTTELLSGDDPWKVAQPELVRRSPIGDELELTPPKLIEEKDSTALESPQLTTKPSIKKMESVEITCLKDDTVGSPTAEGCAVVGDLLLINDSSNFHYRNMAQSVTSTPLTELLDGDDAQPVPMQLPEVRSENVEYLMSNIPNFQSFMQSAEFRPQDISSNVSGSEMQSEVLLEGDSRTFSRSGARDGSGVSERTPTYSDFEDSAVTKPQDVQSSGTSSEDFRQFESSVRHRPQDLSSLIDASSLFLKSERLSSEFAMSSFMNTDSDLTSRSASFAHTNDTQAAGFSSSNFSNLIESHNVDISPPVNVFVTDLDLDDENEQPHSIIITESQMVQSKLSISPNKTYDSHTKGNLEEGSHNFSYDSHACRSRGPDKDTRESGTQGSTLPIVNGVDKMENHTQSLVEEESLSSKNFLSESKNDSATRSGVDVSKNSPKEAKVQEDISTVQCNGKSEQFATVHFLNEAFEELMESNVDDNDTKDPESKGEATNSLEKSHEVNEVCESTDGSLEDKSSKHSESVSDYVVENLNFEESANTSNGQVEIEEEVTSATQSFLLSEKNFCQFDAYLPLLSDIRFTGPASEIMSTSFTQDSPTEPTSPECEQDSKPDPTGDILKEWDSDSESQSSNSSSGEFIWKDGAGLETALVPSTRFDHHRDGAAQGGARSPTDGDDACSARSGDSGSGSGSGSEGDEVEFVPSSWDCSAAPAKSSLRSLEQPPDSKKRVVFKRQKYHCVYEYPREAPELEAAYPPYLPDLSTYCDWESANAEEAELGYGQLFGAPSPLDLYPLRAGAAFGADYDEDFFISSSARPFESVGVMSSGSQFFPGLHKPPPSPPPPPLALPCPPSLDLTTPDSGVEDVTPGCALDEELDAEKRLGGAGAGAAEPWRPPDSASSSESASPSSPGGEALGGLRHTRDKLKLDLPPSPCAHVPSPRHGKVFTFAPEKPRRAPPAAPPPEPAAPEPTFSTFGKSRPEPAAAAPADRERAIVLTDEEAAEGGAREPVRGEGTLLDSGDEDSGIESSSKATLERAKQTPATPAAPATPATPPTPAGPAPAHDVS